MFIYNAFTKNSPVMREYLRSIGYVEAKYISLDLEYLFTSSVHGVYGTFNKRDIERYSSPEHVIGGRTDLTSNPELFKAVVALRDDSDKNQWFCSPLFDEWMFCEIDMFYAPSEYEYHKASVQELIEHFSERYSLGDDRFDIKQLGYKD